MNRKILIPVFLFLLQTFIFINVFAQSKIDSKIDAQQIVIGDQLRYFITATIDTSKNKLQWANFPDTFNTLEIVEKGKIDTVRNGAIVNYKQRLLLTGFDSGSYLIPRFCFVQRNQSGILDSLFTDSFRLMVNTVAVDTTKPFKAIKNIASVETSWLDNLPLIIGSVLVSLLIIGLIWYYLKKRKQTEQIIVPEKVETLQELTLRKLKELDEKHLWQQGKVKEYYTELSEIIRHYIELRFKTPAMELTTDELLRKAKKHREMASFRSALKPLLESADLAKFAKANPLPEEHIEAMELANNFVSVSKPKEDLNHNPQTQTK